MMPQCKWRRRRKKIQAVMNMKCPATQVLTQTLTQSMSFPHFLNILSPLFLCIPLSEGRDGIAHPLRNTDEYSYSLFFVCPNEFSEQMKSLKGMLGHWTTKNTWCLKADSSSSSLGVPNVQDHQRGHYIDLMEE
jgi:hypothetical protein